MFLPAQWKDKRTIQYVNPADDNRPKLKTDGVLRSEYTNNELEGRHHKISLGSNVSADSSAISMAEAVNSPNRMRE